MTRRRPRSHHLTFTLLLCLPLTGAQCIQEGGFECVFSAGCDGGDGQGDDTNVPDDDPDLTQPQTCEELRDVFGAVVGDEAASRGACAEHADCEAWSATINCSNEVSITVCDVAVASADLAGAKDAADGVVDQLCLDVDESCELTPDCVEDLIPACIDGGCELVEELPDDPLPTCEEAAVSWALGVDAILQGRTSCEFDDDCTLWTPALSCSAGSSFGECPLPVSAASVGALQQDLGTTNDALCDEVGEQACLSTPSCPGTSGAICQEGVCVADFPDGGLCPMNIDPFVGSNGGTIACSGDESCDAPCDDLCQFGGSSNCGFSAFCVDGVWGGNDGFGFSELRPPSRCLDSCEGLEGTDCSMFGENDLCGDCELVCTGGTWATPEDPSCGP